MFRAENRARQKFCENARIDFGPKLGLFFKLIVWNQIKDVSTSSKFSILSNVSSLASGGIFEADRDDNDEDTVRAEDIKQVGPEMGHIKGIKNKAMRTEEYLKLQRQKRKVFINF